MTPSLFSLVSCQTCCYQTKVKPVTIITELGGASTKIHTATFVSDHSWAAGWREGVPLIQLLRPHSDRPSPHPVPRFVRRLVSEMMHFRMEPAAKRRSCSLLWQR